MSIFSGVPLFTETASEYARRTGEATTQLMAQLLPQAMQAMTRNRQFGQQMDFEERQLQLRRDALNFQMNQSTLAQEEKLRLARDAQSDSMALADYMRALSQNPNGEGVDPPTMMTPQGSSGLLLIQQRVLEQKLSRTAGALQSEAADAISRIKDPTARANAAAMFAGDVEEKGRIQPNTMRYIFGFAEPATGSRALTPSDIFQRGLAKRANELVDAGLVSADDLMPQGQGIDMQLFGLANEQLAAIEASEKYRGLRLDAEAQNQMRLLNTKVAAGTFFKRTDAPEVDRQFRQILDNNAKRQSNAVNRVQPVRPVVTPPPPAINEPGTEEAAPVPPAPLASPPQAAAPTAPPPQTDFFRLFSGGEQQLAAPPEENFIFDFTTGRVVPKR